LGVLPNPDGTKGLPAERAARALLCLLYNEAEYPFGTGEKDANPRSVFHESGELLFEEIRPGSISKRTETHDLAKAIQGFERRSQPTPAAGQESASERGRL
jgi:hypothetical protein